MNKLLTDRDWTIMNFKKVLVAERKIHKDGEFFEYEITTLSS